MLNLLHFMGRIDSILINVTRILLLTSCKEKNRYHCDSECSNSFHNNSFKGFSKVIQIACHYYSELVGNTLNPNKNNGFKKRLFSILEEEYGI